MLARVVIDLAQQQPAAIAQLRVVGAELMTGIDHGARFGVGPQGVATKELGEYRVLGHGRVEVEQRHGGVAGNHHARRIDRLGQHVGGKRVSQPGKTVIEGQFV